MNQERSWSLFLLGQVVVSLGIVLIIKAELGASPWTVFHIGLTNHFPLRVGQAGQLTGVLVVGISFVVARVKPSLATIMNIIIVGLLIDFLVPIIPKPELLFFRSLYLLGGILIFGSGAGTYIAAQCGTGPRDSLMMALDKKLDFQLGLIRNGIELTALTIGYLLGGPVGIGTICTALGVGPIVEFSLQVMNNLFNNSPLPASNKSS